jgi:hypothetical protein
MTRPWKGRGGSPRPNLTSTACGTVADLITQFLVSPYLVPRHIRRLQLWGLHLALGARFRVLPIEIHKIEVHKIKEIFSPIPPESEEKLATILRTKDFGACDARSIRATRFVEAQGRDTRF